MVWLLMCLQQRSGVMEPTMHGWALDSNAREAKQRLDQKLRSSNRADAAIKRSLINIIRSIDADPRIPSFFIIPFDCC